jgi:uncharacterized protein YneF (UPF0154 family)
MNKFANIKNMEDSIRFADQSKALWLQHNNNNNTSNTMSGSHDPLNEKSRKEAQGCMGRCPFASIIATVITLCGTGVFCGCLYRALSITVQMLSQAFNVEWQMEWLKVLQTVVIIISSVMGTLSIILLIVGCLATGATRSQIYTGFRSRLGGRISTGFFTTIVYLLFLVWSVVALFLVVPIVGYYILMKNCQYKAVIMDSHPVQKEDHCLSLKNYGIQLSEYKS